MRNLLWSYCKMCCIGLCLFLFTAFQAFGQGTVRGFVYEEETGEPVMFATVMLENTTFGTTTDMSGFFNFSNIPVGSYRLTVTYIGYENKTKEITVSNGNITNESLLLSEGEGVDLATVEVSGKKEEARTDVKVSSVTVTTKQIKALPSAGGEADIAQYLQVLPGVVFTGDQGGQLYIRGGSPIQNKIMLDGMTIYNPFHSIGFFSVFETEAIRNVDVLTGGFNAEHGGRISAIVDITTRDGNKKKMGGLVSASPFQVKALLEGPMKKLKEGSTGSSSYMFTAKHSYLEQTSKSLYSYVDTAGLPYGYTDFYGKLSFNSDNGSKLNLFGFNFNDGVNYNGIANLGWRASGAGAKFKLVPNNTKLIIDGNVGYSDYNVELTEADGQPRNSGITGFNVGLNFSYYGEKTALNYGFNLEGFATDFKFTNFLGYQIEQFQNTTELSAYGIYKLNVGDKLIIEPSLHLHYYASLSETVLEPRFGLKYNITDRLRFKLAGGMYSQNLISTVNEQDVVNLFVGFLSGPEEIIYDVDGERTHKLQKSVHAVAGLEIDVTKKITLNVEPYYKGFTQLINLNRNKLEITDPDYVTETGEAYGLDFLLKYTHKDLFVWCAYSIGYVNRDDGEQVYPTLFDRRHNVNFVSSYAFGGDKSWEAGLRWNLGTGFPFTLTQGFYEYVDFADGLDTDITTSNNDLGILFDEDRNAGRLPTYHRLDLSVKKTIEFSKYSDLTITASVTNAYNRENIFYFDRVRYDRVNQLPILPSLSFLYNF